MDELEWEGSDEEGEYIANVGSFDACVLIYDDGTTNVEVSFDYLDLRYSKELCQEILELINSHANVCGARGDADV